MTSDVYRIQTLTDTILLESSVQLWIGYAVLESIPHAVKGEFALIKHA